MYRITWDSEDCRFDYFDGTYWEYISNAIKSIKNACNIDRDYLVKIMIDDGWDESNFNEWVDWCIEKFLYIEKIQLQDNFFK